MRSNQIALVANGQDDMFELVTSQLVEQYVEKWPVANSREGLRSLSRHASQASPCSSAEDDGISCAGHRFRSGHWPAICHTPFPARIRRRRSLDWKMRRECIEDSSSAPLMLVFARAAHKRA